MWTPAARAELARETLPGVESHYRDASVTEVSTVRLDLAKYVFLAYGTDSVGGPVFCEELRRKQVLALFATKPSCVVALKPASATGP